MIDEKREIGQRLKEFASKNFPSLADFARNLGKDPTYFTAYYRGDSILGGDMLKNLLNIGCNINWLLSGKGDMQFPLYSIREPQPDYQLDIVAKLIEQNQKIIEENQLIIDHNRKLYAEVNFLKEELKNIFETIENKDEIISRLSVLFAKINDYGKGKSIG